MSEKKSVKNTNKNTKERKFQKGSLVFTTLTEDNRLYINNPNELQLAQYLSISNKNTLSMRNDGSAFAFTDYSIYELNTINSAGEIIDTGFYVVAYDFSSHTCYYSMSKGLANEFIKLKENKIIPSNGLCKWIVKAVEKTFTTEDNKVQRTFNLDVIGIENLSEVMTPEITAKSIPELEAASDD